MKKLFALFFATALLMLSVNCSAAMYNYSSDMYSIDLPEDYSLASENNFIDNSGNAFAVAFEENTEGLCIADLDEAGAQEYAQAITDKGEEAFESVDIDGKIEIVSHKIIENLNRKTALEIVIKTTVKQDSAEAVRWQKMLIFTCEENIYSFTFTAAEETAVNAFDESFKTIVIAEKQIQSKSDSFSTIVMGAVIVALILLGVVKFIIKMPYRKHIGNK